jgi:AcrR family transcriptional regulator
VAGTTRRLRADAERNRIRILDAARDVFIEQGPDAPLDEVARRAGIGIGTLYRRFPDRAALVRAVALDALERTVEEAHEASQEEPDAFAALTRYLHRALDTRVAAVFPTLMGALTVDDPGMMRARDAGSKAMQTLIDAAHRSGSLRRDVTFADLGLLLVRLSRPVPPFDRELNDRLAHRHLDLVVAGLRAEARPLSGPAMSLADLRASAAAGGRSDIDRPASRKGPATGTRSRSGASPPPPPRSSARRRTPS